MSTTTDWDLGPDPYVKDSKGKRPYQDATPAPPAQDEVPDEPRKPDAPRVKPRRKVNPLVQWYEDMRNDTAARKDRSDGRWWLMRCMGEQPTSVRDHLDFVLHQREKRPNGGRGWGLRTEALLIDGVHAFFYVVHGLLIALPLTLTWYALAWIAQRPGRFWLFVGLLAIVISNLSTWLA
jgi:hypothetical protein